MYLQHHAVVSRSLVLAFVVLTIVDISMIQLEKTHEVSGCLNKRKKGLKKKTQQKHLGLIAN